jgi:alanyl-tRNA synthetase
MLGNFSFGDYFKKEAIAFAWEFLTRDLNMNDKDLWVSVYKDDAEAYDIWLKDIGVPADKIIRLGQESNFWPANAPALGPDGPCGPCSEIFFDRGRDVGCGRSTCNPDCDCSRFVEVWNLVFTQFNRAGENRLMPLPQKNIDTGMGLERMACVLQSKESNFEIDILRPVVDEVIKILRLKSRASDARALVNAIVDHSRAAVFAVADGVYPSNEERGYVIRKIIRKASWSAHLLNFKKPFIHSLPSLFVHYMGDFYPELKEKKDVIIKVIKAEEERFLSTLEAGEAQLLSEIKSLKGEQKDRIGAKALFKLYDTYGFPLELSKETASNYALKVDEEGFKALLKEQQERSRKQSMFDESIFTKKDFDLKEKTEFLGYENCVSESSILRIFVGEEEKDTVSEGREAALVLDKTPFYAESGGQLDDRGYIKALNGEFEVEKVFKVGDAALHKGRVVKGNIDKGPAQARIDQERRKALARAHTATHLLQAALRQVLGEHVSQQGSFVDEDRFRFDFTHFQALSPEEILKVEEFVNGYILNADSVSKEYLSFDAAKKEGALAFFKDKYSDTVRVVSIADYSKELCGGTHLNNTSEAGLFVIESESSISSGIRRIEALVGRAAQDYMSQMRSQLAALSRKFKSKDVLTAAENILAQDKLKDGTIKGLKKLVLESHIGAIQADKKTINGYPFITYKLRDADYDGLLHVCDVLRKKESSLFVFLTSTSDNKRIFVCAASDDFIKKGLSCKKFITRFRNELSLRGGGRDSSAQGVIEAEIDEGYLLKVEKYFSTFTEQ